jgi:hypothetical protein
MNIQKINALDEFANGWHDASQMASQECPMVGGEQDHRIEALVLDLVEWVAAEPRPYAEVMEAWRTSCPRLAVWEEAVDRGLLVSEPTGRGGVLVAATPAGRGLLEAQGRAARIA